MARKTFIFKYYEIENESELTTLPLIEGAPPLVYSLDNERYYIKGVDDNWHMVDMQPTIQTNLIYDGGELNE